MCATCAPQPLPCCPCWPCARVVPPHLRSSMRPMSRPRGVSRRSALSARSSSRYSDLRTPHKDEEDKCNNAVSATLGVAVRTQAQGGAQLQGHAVKRLNAALQVPRTKATDPPADATLRVCITVPRVVPASQVRASASAPVLLDPVPPPTPPAREHAVRLPQVLGHQVVHQGAQVGGVARQRHGGHALRPAGRVDARQQALRSGLLVACGWGAGSPFVIGRGCARSTSRWIGCGSTP